jgi:pyrroline-5-carboxylate reductase
VTRRDAELGILGVGSIAEAIVTGLGDDFLATTRVVLSPRSRARSAALAERFPSIQIATDNQDLVDRSRMILLCLRPQDAGPALAGLSFGADQQVISVVAVLSLDQVRRLVTPAEVLARAIPLPAVAQRQGLTAICPDDERTRELFERLGSTLCVDDETLLDSLSAATATIAAHLAYVATIGGWLTSKGIPNDDAQRYVAATFAPLGDMLRNTPVDLAQLAKDHATPGGLNEQFLASLREGDLFGLVERGLDQVEDRVRGR